MKRFLRGFLRAFIVVGGAALCVLLVLAVWPGSVLLAVPGIRVASPYCSRWKAARDAGALLRSAEFEKEIAAAARIERRDGKYVLWRTPKGSYWLPDGPADLLPKLLAQQARSVYGEIRPGEVVIDCGAHVGTFAATALARGASVVVAVEPAPDALACLRRNLASEIASGKVVVVPKGIWDSNTTLQFFLNGNSDAADSFLVHGSQSRSVEVPVTTIDTLATELSLPRVGLIKTDVKGATQRALKGAAAVIARDRPRLALATEEPPEDPRSIAVLLGSLAPWYRMTCGPCLLVGDEIRTDVVFFE